MINLSEMFGQSQVELAYIGYNSDYNVLEEMFWYNREQSIASYQIVFIVPSIPLWIA